jgi:hypothetical protein
VWNYPEQAGVDAGMLVDAGILVDARHI